MSIKHCMLILERWEFIVWKEIKTEGYEQRINIITMVIPIFQ